jgi:catechol 2,3-dioxygenase-like lactoylglutathione lyase family enzyme
MTEETGAPRVRQLRLAVRADDYDAALTFFRDVLGLPEREAYSADGGAEVTILRGRGIANRAQVATLASRHPKASRSRSSRNWAR